MSFLPVRRALALCATLALAACLPPATVRRMEPGFAGLSFCRLEGNALRGGDLRLGAERSDSTGREPTYQLLLDQLGARELPLRAGEPLRLSLGADSLMLAPAATEPERRVVEAEFVHTRWRYHATEAELRRLADAAGGDLAVPSSFGVVRTRLTPASLGAVGRFLEQCSRGAPVAARTGPAEGSGNPDQWRPVNEKELTTTPSGLRYHDEQVGTGQTAKAGDRVAVHYTGWLENGTKFDSSRDRGQPFEFALGAGQVIRGWDEGVQGMKVGGRRRLVIPAALGYGSRAMGNVIPANSTLVFDVELLAIR